MQTVVLFHIIFLSTLVITITIAKHTHGPPNGFYKITNQKDGTVLTATKQPGPNGSRPWKVITTDWKSSNEQEWKVKAKTEAGRPYQIIRNEKIHDNEVTKEKNLDKILNKNDYIQINWNFIEAGNGYELNDGNDCLRGNGPGQEVKYVTCIDADHEENIDKSYLWTLEKLFEIPDYKPKEEFQ